MKLSPEMQAKVLALADQCPKVKRSAKATAKAVKALAASASAELRLVVTIPLKLVSGANAREHWAAKHRRVKTEREAVKMACVMNSYVAATLQGLTHQLAKEPTFRVAVRLVRLGGRAWDDDNNVSGLKAVRDAVADWWLLQDDGSDRVRYTCDQEPGGLVGVRIELEARE